MRRTKSIQELIRWLYLKGISTGDLNQALAALLGERAPGLSATSVARMKEVWRREYERGRSLSRFSGDLHAVKLKLQIAIKFGL